MKKKKQELVLYRCWRTAEQKATRYHRNRTGHRRTEEAVPRKKVKIVFGEGCAMCLVQKGLRKETDREEEEWEWIGPVKWAL